MKNKRCLNVSKTHWTKHGKIQHVAKNVTWSYWAMWLKKTTYSKTPKFTNNVCYTCTSCFLLGEKWQFKNAPPRMQLVSRRNCSKWVCGKRWSSNFRRKNIIFSVSAILVSKTCCSIVIPKTEIYEPTRDFFGGFFQNLIHAEMIFFPHPGRRIQKNKTSTTKVRSTGFKHKYIYTSASSKTWRAPK